MGVGKEDDNNTENALELTMQLSEIDIGVGTRNVLMEEIGDLLGRIKRRLRLPHW
jgi:hypothetical protein